MSKRSKKDIKNISDEISSLVGQAQIAQDTDNSLTPSLILEGIPAGKRKTVKKTSKTMKTDAVTASISEDADPEFEALLLQVDQMLTEMTKSKWLSSDWPNLEFENRKKH